MKVNSMTCIVLPGETISNHRVISITRRMRHLKSNTRVRTIETNFQDLFRYR